MLKSLLFLVASVVAVPVFAQTQTQQYNHDTAQTRDGECEEKETDAADEKTSATAAGVLATIARAGCTDAGFLALGDAAFDDGEDYEVDAADSTAAGVLDRVLGNAYLASGNHDWGFSSWVAANYHYLDSYNSHTAARAHFVDAIYFSGQAAYKFDHASDMYALGTP